MLSDNTVCFAGDFPTDSVEFPVLAKDEYFTQVEAGTDMFTGVTNKGKVYSWGGNTLGQSDSPKNISNAANIYAGSFQSYAVDANGSLVDKWGLKGYLFGTDKYGADVFQRIANGGRMTMTIGAVSVIISSIIDRYTGQRFDETGEKA